MTWFLLSLLACDRSTLEDDDDGGGITVETTAPDTDEPAEDTGWECNPWYPCQDCGGAACGPELSDCLSSGACSSGLNAWAACVLDCGDPEACAADFASSGGEPAVGLVSCVSSSCAQECDL